MTECEKERTRENEEFSRAVRRAMVRGACSVGLVLEATLRECNGSVNFCFVRSKRSRLRVPLKLHIDPRLRPNSNRHERESARRSSETANATLFAKEINYSIIDRELINFSFVLSFS